MAAIQTTRETADQIIKCFKSGHKLLLVGNGGSAAEASHFATELVCKFKKERKALPAIALTNPAIISAISNDYGYQYVFSRQVEAYSVPGDLLIALSTSGKSVSILNAIKKAQELGVKVISFPTNSELDTNTPQTQEMHLVMIHNICKEVEKEFK